LVLDSGGGSVGVVHFVTDSLFQIRNSKDWSKTRYAYN